MAEAESRSIKRLRDAEPTTEELSWFADIQMTN